MKLTTRHLVRGRGLHRAPAQRPEGALVGQKFVRCGQCGGVESAATVHGTQLRCAEGHLVPAGGAM
ncbi:hypothetical protein [Streptomyces spinosisporus]|uniref:Uncharacterized protein n=1 Tax=Streptomyces spinosisporus TaxID=2927582 RepID=A0ABS9XWQ9_9ACTN|nr:hypothetical protein [Streptomyces spinosisporus]MCI3246496.1 hypothetical protein [Streptomyces spinosisporus]